MAKWTLLLSFVVTAVGLLVVGWRRPEEVHMNGPLCAAHASIEGQCPACHPPWRPTRVRRSLCASGECHRSVQEETTHTRPAVDVACGECHTEHQGRTAHACRAAMDPWCVDCHKKDVPQWNHPFHSNCCVCHYYHLPSPSAPLAEPRYDHLKNPHGEHLELVGTLLQISDGNRVCGHCHGEADRKGAVRRAGHNDCGGSECHKNTDRAKPSKDCKQCHTLCSREKETGIRFSHAGHTKERIKVSCEECHIVTDPKPQFVRLNKKFCLDCHNVKHDEKKDISSKECAYCHMARETPRTSRVRFDHKAHAETACLACHKDLPKAAKLPGARLLTAPECAKCHDETGAARP